MTAVAVRILHVEAGDGAGPLERSLAAVRGAAADRLAHAFAAAGAADVSVLAGPPDDTPFGRRLRQLVAALPSRGIVVAGAGSLVHARPADLRSFLEVAASEERVALANNRYSGDAVAIARPDALAELPDLPSDNALPRWLAERAGYAVRDLRAVRRLQIDVDGPIDALVAGIGWPDDGVGGADRARERIDAVAAVARDANGELLVAGRTSAATHRWLERCTSARVRVLAEERGLRAAAAAARGTASPNRRPPRSILGQLLDERGPAALGAIAAGVADAAVIDSRVLLAHRYGADERSWPALEDRLASDLLLADRIRDDWLRDLTASAADAAVPIVLGGHTLVGPGLPLALRGPA